MNRKVTLTGANIVFLIFTVVFIIYQIVFVIIFGEKFLTDNIYLMLIINELVVILAPVLIYSFIKKVNFRETFRLNKPGLIPCALILLLSVPAYFVAMMLNNIVVYLLQFIGTIPNQPIPVPKSIAELIVGLLIIAVLPGICEETMHRGLLLKAYEKRGTFRALVITSIFFGVFHFDITNLLGPIVLGALFGYYVIRTNSIFAGMLAHFLNNAIAELGQYLWGEKSPPENVTVSSQELLQLIVLGVIGLVISWLLVKVFRNMTEGRATLIPPIAGIKRDIISVLSHWPVVIVLALYFLMMMIYILSIIIMKITGQ
jgi:uncharacterized protein